MKKAKNGVAAPVERLLDVLLDVGLGQERRHIDRPCTQSAICALWQLAIPVQLKSPTRNILSLTYEHTLTSTQAPLPTLHCTRP